MCAEQTKERRVCVFISWQTVQFYLVWLHCYFCKTNISVFIRYCLQSLIILQFMFYYFIPTKGVYLQGRRAHQSSSIGVFQWLICMTIIYHLLLHQSYLPVISRLRKDATWQLEGARNAAGGWEALSAHLLEVIPVAAGRAACAEGSLPPDDRKQTERGSW